MSQNGSYRDPMTTTNVAGVPAELRGAIARAGLSQEDACDHAGLSRTTYYRRVTSPEDWRLGELEAMAVAAGCLLSITLVPVTHEHTGRRSETGEPDAYSQPCTASTEVDG
jgi:hypothetical protein